MAGVEPQVEVVAYRPEWREDFARLNREWLERYFSVEEFDERMFADPEALILAPGGGIFFARAGAKDATRASAAAAIRLGSARGAGTTALFSALACGR